jgi:peptide/nickel transport system permease protein
MLWYATRQLLLVIPTLAGVAVAVFFLIRVMPGDVVVVKLRADEAAVSEETIQAERKRLGLDGPLYQQFGEYMLGLPRLDPRIRLR